MKNKTYSDAYFAAQAGGMNNTDSDEFAQGEVERELKRLRAIKREASATIAKASTWAGDTTSAPKARKAWTDANNKMNSILAS